MPNILIVRNTYPDLPTLKRVLQYIHKNELCGGYGIDPDHAYDQMYLVKEAYHKTEGVQLKHFMISLSNGEMAELDFHDLMKLGFEIGKVFGEYQMVYCIHLDSDHTRIHFWKRNIRSFRRNGIFGRDSSRRMIEIKEGFPEGLCKALWEPVIIKIATYG